jgi:hypothetical protein
MLGGYHFFGYMLVLIFKMIFQESGLSYIYIYIYVKDIKFLFKNQNLDFTISNISPLNIQGNSHNLNNNIQFFN